MKGLLFIAAAVGMAAVVGAALKIGGGKLKAKNLLICTAAAVLGIAAVVVPFLLGAFFALLRWAKNLPP